MQHCMRPLKPRHEAYAVKFLDRPCKSALYDQVALVTGEGGGVQRLDAF